jgi:DinB family protein
MTLKTLIAASCVWAIAASASAQTSADPVSGTWTGQMGQDGNVMAPIAMTMKFDGKNITGTVTGPPHPADIKTGTYDPHNGALKLNIVVQDDSSTPVVFDGTLVGGTAMGRVILPNQTGHFKVEKGTASAAGQPAGDAAAALRKSFGDVSGWVTQAADLVPADKYSYRPVETVRTYGQLVAHVADAYNYFCARASGRSVQWSDAIEKGNTDKATVVAKLRQSLDTCNTAYAGGGAIQPLVDNVGHTNLHYGNIITYVRMMGLVPPSSR